MGGNVFCSHAAHRSAPYVLYIALKFNASLPSIGAFATLTSPYAMLDGWIMRDMTPANMLIEEFGCYYLDGEFDLDDSSLKSLAGLTASNVCHYLDATGIDGFVSLLLSVREDPSHPVVHRIKKETMIDWSRGHDWPIFQRQLDWIIDFSRAELAKRLG